jgi:hypothetical protein
MTATEKSAAPGVTALTLMVLVALIPAIHDARTDDPLYLPDNSLDQIREMPGAKEEREQARRWHQELQLQQLRQEMDSQRFEIERERHERRMKEFRDVLEPKND